MDPIQRITQINEQNALKAAEDAKHHELVDVNAQTQEVILKSFSSLIDYLDNKVTKTEVINQLEKISTPDVAYVVSAVNGMHDTLKTHENVDLSEITAVMKEVLAEAKAIPKELPELPEPDKPVDYSDRFTSLEAAVNAITDAVKEQETTIEAPVVNVPETKVNVDAPDLKPISKDLEKVEKAVKSLVFPEYKTDNKEVEKLLTKQNKILNEILDKPVGGGSGGGGRATPYESGGVPAFVELNGGAIPTVDLHKIEATPYAEVLTASATISPGVGARLQLLKVQVAQSPANDTANLVTLNFTSLGDVVTGWAYSDSNEWIGAVDEVLNINLSNTNPVSVNIRYKEI